MFQLMSSELFSCSDSVMVDIDQVRMFSSSFLELIDFNTSMCPQLFGKDQCLIYSRVVLQVKRWMFLGVLGHQRVSKLTSVRVHFKLASVSVETATMLIPLFHLFYHSLIKLFAWMSALFNQLTGASLVLKKRGGRLHGVQYAITPFLKKVSFTVHSKQKQLQWSFGSTYIYFYHLFFCY